MKNIIIEDEESAVKYIEYVLSEWDAWKTHHVLLVQALEILLKIHQRKTSEVANDIFREIEKHSHITFINGNEDNPLLLVDYEFYNELKANIQREKENGL
jgi:hypothetical protein